MMASGEIRLSGTTMRRMPVLAQSQAGSDPCAAGGCIDQVTVTASRPPPAFFLGFPSMFFAPAGTDFQALWQLGRQFAAQGLSAKQLGVQIANNPLINFQILSKAQGLGYGFYQDAANFAVGVVSEGFFNGSYIGWAEMSFGGQIYGAWNSTNWNTSMPGYWQTWWNAGWNAASNGNFPVQVGTPLQMSYPLQ
jgi:hypothetical protein